MRDYYTGTSLSGLDCTFDIICFWNLTVAKSYLYDLVLFTSTFVMM